MCSGAPTHADRSVDRTARRFGLGSVAVGASAVSPGTLRAADQPILARESMSVLRRMLKMRQTAAWLRGRRAEPDPLSSADFGPAAQRSRFVRLCYKNWPFVSSGHGIRRDAGAGTPIGP